MKRVRIPSPGTRYLLILWGDVEPEVRGPYKSYRGLLGAARRIRQHSDKDGVYRAYVGSHGQLTVEAFGNWEIEGK